MKKTLTTAVMTGLLVAGASLQAQATTFTVGDVRFVVDQALTRLTDPGNPAVAGRAAAEQGDQWALARINQIEQRNQFGIFVPIWTSGNDVPNFAGPGAPQYISAVLGGLTLQTDPANPFPGAPNTGLDYNLRIHPVGPGGAHPSDYDTNTLATQTFPHKAYYIADSTTGPAYLKLYGTLADVYAADVAAGAGISGAFGSFGAGTIAGTLLADFAFNATALAIGDGSGFPPDTQSTGADGTLGTGDDTFALLRAFANTDIEAGVLGYFDIIGGAYQSIFNTDSFIGGSDGQIDITARAMPGSPYLLGAPDPETTFGWDFRDAGQGLTAVVPEPSTVLLMGFGLLGLGAYGRKRMKKQ